MCHQIICAQCERDIPGGAHYLPCQERPRGGYTPWGKRRCHKLVREISSAAKIDKRRRRRKRRNLCRECEKGFSGKPLHSRIQHRYELRGPNGHQVVKEDDGKITPKEAKAIAIKDDRGDDGSIKHEQDPSDETRPPQGQVDPDIEHDATSESSYPTTSRKYHRRKSSSRHQSKRAPSNSRRARHDHEVDPETDSAAGPTSSSSVRKSQSKRRSSRHRNNRRKSQSRGRSRMRRTDEVPRLDDISDQASARLDALLNNVPAVIHPRPHAKVRSNSMCAVVDNGFAGDIRPKAIPYNTHCSETSSRPAWV